MDTLSHNEEENRKLALRHIFLPGRYGLVSEAIIAVLALVAFNASSLSNNLLRKNFGTTDPLALWSQLLRQLLDDLGRAAFVQRLFLFVLWAAVGVLAYILIFRSLQIGFDVRKSVGTGVRYIRDDPDRGIYRWFADLHDFFLSALIHIVGITALAVGALLCFGIASQELNNGLAETFPGNAGVLLLSIAGAIISVRLIVLGISLLSRRFRNWYTA